jgi:hypothetical protein
VEGAGAAVYVGRAGQVRTSRVVGGVGSCYWMRLQISEGRFQIERAANLQSNLKSEL